MEEGTASHSSILAWRIPWTEDLMGYGPWVEELDTTEVTEHTCMQKARWHALVIFVNSDANIGSNM